MDATHYHGSKGPAAIADMNPHHLRSAHDKLIRDGLGKLRAPEVEAMAARIAALEAEDKAVRP